MCKSNITLFIKETKKGMLTVIKNLWKETEFYCSHRHEPVKMSYNSGPHSLFYSCPKYYPDNRNENEQACPMRINMVDAEAVLEKLSAYIEDDWANDIERDYTNFEFDYKSVHVKVLEYHDGHFKLNIFNKKALK